MESQNNYLKIKHPEPELNASNNLYLMPVRKSWLIQKMVLPVSLPHQNKFQMNL